jgi:hypothetical protein
MTAVDYPNREHGNADRAAKRRALTALNSIIENAQLLVRALETDTALDPGASRRIADGAVSVAINLSALETLSDVREWHAADVADAATQAANA